MNMKRSKRLLCLFAAVSMITAMVPAAVFADEVKPADIRDPKTAFGITAESAQGGDTEKTLAGKTVILHTNDVHGAIEAYEKAAALKDDLKAKGADVLLFDAGDFMQGKVCVNISHGLSAVELMNDAGYDAAVIGNHEFDFGKDVLFDNLKNAKFEILCANLTENGKTIYTESEIFETASGKIGVFGLDTPETKTKSAPKNTTGLSILSDKEMIACAKKETDTLKANGADLVIALSHLGAYPESRANGNSSYDLYYGVKGLDFVIDGHSHHVMTVGENGEPIQSTGTQFKYIGVIIIDEKGKIEDHFLIPAEDLRSDVTIKAKADAVKAEADDLYNQVFAYSEVYMTGDRTYNRSSQTANGNLVTDAYRWYIENNPDLVDDRLDNTICLQNGGSIRDEMPKGDITRQNIFNIHPFSNTICVIKLSGTELLKLLESMTFSLPEMTGGYPQVNGIKFTVDCTKEYDAGEFYPDSTYRWPASVQRVSIQEVCGKPFDIKAEYYLVTNDFIAAGGDTAYILSTKNAIDSGIGLDDVEIRYIKDALGGLISAEKYGSIRNDVTLITQSAEQSEAEQTAQTPDAGKTDAAAGGTGNVIYVVKRGDCLFRIAESQLGDPLKWRLIYNLNRNKIKDPNLIYPGQELELCE